ncbi:30S ribosomal protein S3 [Sulfuracidifex metallicus]|uniref:30S ribosomal protein S3 n=1 Tax=Sulfuracidifex metallicus TaxID=47303 RepID=UPI002276A7E0|nr:30S ribosomal protein S3 [Sulfuracidifex metallicus]MCY0849215.1 30S ribosomal protein S3 [Sulfuracidifex metallicus]
MVNVRKYFLQKYMTRVMVDQYLAKQFYNAEYSGVEINRSPIGTRVIIYAGRPAMIIGKGGRTIKQLAQILEKHYQIENPQITVTNVEKPELDARVMAFRLAITLEKGYHFRRAAFITVRKIMNAGALGTEVVISGKLSSERARYEKLKEGTVYKSGQSLDYMVDRAIAIATLKPGIFGVEVVITKPLNPIDKMSLNEDVNMNEEGGESPAPSQGAITVTNVSFIDNEGGNKNDETKTGGGES